jgi:hypothetical protein
VDERELVYAPRAQRDLLSQPKHDEKNTVHMNAFMGTVLLGDHPTTQAIRFVTDSEDKEK